VGKKRKKKETCFILFYLKMYNLLPHILYVYFKVACIYCKTGRPLILNAPVGNIDIGFSPAVDANDVNASKCL